MGIILRQSLKSTIINATSAMVGIVSVLIIYERLLSPAELGKIRYIISTSFLILPFVMFGVTMSLIRFFPKFKDKARKHNGIFGLGLGAVIIGNLIFILLSFILGDILPEKFSIYREKILALLFVVSISSVTTAYLSSLKRIVVPAIFNNLLIKIGVPILVIFYSLGKIDFNVVEWNIITVYVLASIGLIFYVRHLGALRVKPNLKIIDKKLFNEIKAYSVYSMLGPMGGVLMTHFDQFMVTEIIDFERGGVYTIAVFVGSLFSIPLLSVFSIANPVISDSYENGDRNNIYSIYKKSSINLFALGLLGLILLWLNIDDLFSFMSKGDIYIQGKYVILFLALAKIIDMVTSVNGAIIAHSEYYRFNLYSLLIFGAINIVGNYFLIKLYGINGAAFSTFVTAVMYNVAKSVYVWKRFHMHPFSINTLKVLCLSLIIYFVAYQFNITFTHTIVGIIVKSLIISAVFGMIIYIMNISEDLNGLINSIIKKIKQ